MLYCAIGVAAKGEKHVHNGTKRHARGHFELKSIAVSLSHIYEIADVPHGVFGTHLVTCIIMGYLSWRGNLLCPIRLLSAKISPVLWFVATTASHTASNAEDILTRLRSCTDLHNSTTVVVVQRIQDKELVLELFVNSANPSRHGGVFV